MLGLSSFKYDTTTVAALYEGAGSHLGRPLPCLRYIPAGAKKARIFVGKCGIVNGALVFECPALIEYCFGLTGKVRSLVCSATQFVGCF